MEVKPVFITERLTSADPTSQALEICKACACVIGEDQVIGAQKLLNHWAIYTKTNSKRLKLLTNGICVAGRSIFLRDSLPERRETEKLIIKDYPMYMDTTILEAKLKELGVKTVCDFRFANIFDHTKKMFTSYRDGNRYVYIEKPEIPLPKKIDIQTSEGKESISIKTFHKMQKEIICCTICKIAGHNAGSSLCEHHEKNDAVTIYGNENVLSNFSPCTMDIDGASFMSIEHAFQFSRAKKAGDSDLAEKIQAIKEPWKTKLLAATIEDSEGDYDTLKEIVETRTRQDEQFRDSLLETGSEILALAVPDIRWGAGLYSKEATNVNPQFWPGRNLYGQILMYVRNCLSGKKKTKNTKDQKSLVQSKIEFQKDQKKRLRETSSPEANNKKVNT